MKKCIIYDCDGVIVDSEIIASKVDAHFLNNLGCSVDDEECTKLFLGRNANHIQEIVLNHFGIKLSNEILCSIHQNIFERFDSELQPLIEDSLAFFYQKKVGQCVSSNSKRAWILKALNAANQFRFFKEETIFSGEDVKNGKPSPDIFLLAARRMGYQENECIIVEDSPAGIEAALNANISVIGFMGGTHAQYNWYKERITKYNIPIAYNQKQLHDLLICNFF